MCPSVVITTKCIRHVVNLMCIIIQSHWMWVHLERIGGRWRKEGEEERKNKEGRKEDNCKEGAGGGREGEREGGGSKGGRREKGRGRGEEKIRKEGR